MSTYTVVSANKIPKIGINSIILFCCMSCAKSMAHGNIGTLGVWFFARCLLRLLKASCSFGTCGRRKYFSDYQMDRKSDSQDRTARATRKPILLLRLCGLFLLRIEHCRLSGLLLNAPPRNTRPFRLHPVLENKMPSCPTIYSTAWLFIHPPNIFPISSNCLIANS